MQAAMYFSVFYVAYGFVQAALYCAYGEKRTRWDVSAILIAMVFAPLLTIVIAGEVFRWFVSTYLEGTSKRG